MTVSQLILDKKFWATQEAEFHAVILDLVAPEVADDQIRFAATLYLQHMRSSMADRRENQ